MESLLKKDKIPVVLDELVTYFLAQCATTKDVAFLASTFAVINKSTKNSFLNLDGFLPLHLMFSDADGRSVILEPDHNGEFKVHENNTGIMTNSSTYDWHLTNLRNYVNLSDYTTSSLQVGNLDIKDIESGSGLWGLPGDFTSPSRFIKITLLTNMMETPDSDNALNRLYTTFNSVIIPKGVEKDSPTKNDSTAYWAGYDISQRELQILSMESQTFTKISLNDLQETFGTTNATVLVSQKKDVYHGIK